MITLSMVNCHNCPQIPAKKGGRENYKYYDVDGLGNMDRVSLHNHIVKHWKLRLLVLPVELVGSNWLVIEERYPVRRVSVFLDSMAGSLFLFDYILIFLIVRSTGQWLFGLEWWVGVGADRMFCWQSSRFSLLLLRPLPHSAHKDKRHKDKRHKDRGRKKDKWHFGTKKVHPQSHSALEKHIKYKEKKSA